MKIYVISKGEYSWYHIYAATTDKRRAEFLRDMASTTGSYGTEARIEEFDDYAELTPIKGELYEVMICYDRKGRQTDLYCSKESFVDNEYIEEGIRYKEENLHGRIDEGKSSTGEVYYSAFVVAESEEKAEKIGIDMIQKYRAEKMGL